MEDFWRDEDYFTSPAFTDEQVTSIESKLGFKLPTAYLELLKTRNGGSPIRDCFPTDIPTSWAKDHIAIEGIKGIGGKWGIDSPETGSQVWLDTMNCKIPGIVVCECPSAGHDVVMLDYSDCGLRGEPRVIHVETEVVGDPVVTQLAENFSSFLAGLRSEDDFDLE